MDFMSSRQSHAQSFISQTQNNSYLISSRRKLIPDDDAQNDLRQFKQQIQYKFIRSIANKTYVYPLSEQAYQTFNDETEYKQLIKVREYDLSKQNEQIGFKKQQFKMKSVGNQMKSVSNLLESIRSEKNRIQDIRMLINQNFRKSATSYKGRESLQAKKSAKLITNQSHRNTRQNHVTDIIYEQPQELLMRKKRLLTEPYEKSNNNYQKNLGFIIKRK